VGAFCYAQAMSFGFSRRSFLVGLCFMAAFAIESWAIERTPVDSTNLASVGYDAAARVLEIEFHSGGVYRYREVPRAVFDALLAAESKGRYFLEHIRGKFAFDRVTEAAR
jgi:hypothetical protein